MNPPDFSAWLEIDPYAYDAERKYVALTRALSELTQWHAAQCKEYQHILKVQGIHSQHFERLEDVPFIPASLFKEFELLSIPRNEIFKTLTSSATSGQKVSKIFLDRATASMQTKVLSRLMRHVLGAKRIPMLIIDTPDVLQDRLKFSARGAGILGFSLFGQDITYALDSSMNLDTTVINDFTERHSGQPIIIFGFTFMIWQYFILPLQNHHIRLPLDLAIVMHGGGWKKMQDQSVNNSTFKATLKSLTRIGKVINYYGMVEQTGSIFLECEFGHLHAPVYADIIVRRPLDFSVAPIGEEGIIEILSMLPISYPGHVLLTEDVGVLLGEDDCKCGRLGKHFLILGRLTTAEIRGCSDTHEPHS